MESSVKGPGQGGAAWPGPRASGRERGKHSGCPVHGLSRSEEHAGRFGDSTPVSSPSRKLEGARERRAKDARLREGSERGQPVGLSRAHCSARPCSLSDDTGHLCSSQCYLPMTCSRVTGGWKECGVFINVTGQRLHRTGGASQCEPGTGWPPASPVVENMPLPLHCPVASAHCPPPASRERGLRALQRERGKPCPDAGPATDAP